MSTCGERDQSLKTIYSYIPTNWQTDAHCNEAQACAMKETIEAGTAVQATVTQDERKPGYYNLVVTYCHRRVVIHTASEGASVRLCWQWFREIG